MLYLITLAVYHKCFVIQRSGWAASKTKHTTYKRMKRIALQNMLIDMDCLVDLIKGSFIETLIRVKTKKK